MKAKKKWTLNSLVTSALRKIWARSPFKAEALRLALVNPEDKKYNQVYHCSKCGNDFLLQQVEVNHKEDGYGLETWDEWLDRIFLGVQTVTWLDGVPLINGAMLPSMEELVKEHLEVVCKPCHTLIGKEQRAKAKAEKKSKK